MQISGRTENKTPKRVLKYQRLHLRTVMSSGGFFSLPQTPKITSYEKNPNEGKRDPINLNFLVPI